MVHFRSPVSRWVFCWTLGAASFAAGTDAPDVVTTSSVSVSTTDHPYSRSLQRGTCPKEALTPSDVGKSCEGVDLYCPLVVECPVQAGTTCVDPEISSVCGCVDNVWSCSVPSCTPCIDWSSECPEESLQVSDMAGPCDITEGVFCPFDMPSCATWDGQACIDHIGKESCMCGGGQWLCPMVSCIPCFEPPEIADPSCPEKKLGQDKEECNTEGSVCPLLTGECKVWDGQACVPKELYTYCLCTNVGEWFCSPTQCPPCRPTIAINVTECPENPLQEADISDECDVPQTLSCPFNAGPCDVWDGTKCVAEDVITSCVCEGGEWVCAIPVCVPCVPPVDNRSCPIGLLQEADINGPCDVEGLDCPFDAGQCEVWNGEACEMQNITARCFCDGEAWLCAVPGCAPCEAPTNIEACPAEGLPSSAINMACEPEGSECPLKGNTCDIWNGTACVPQDVEAMCVCAEMAWTCAIPNCVPCTTQPPPDDSIPTGEPTRSPSRPALPETMPPSSETSVTDGEMPSNAPNGMPSKVPVEVPPSNPTLEPSNANPVPSGVPGEIPLTMPTAAPSNMRPSVPPTLRTVEPSTMRTVVPNDMPSGNIPTGTPTVRSSTIDPTTVSETDGGTASFTSSSMQQASCATSVGMAIMAVGWTLATYN